MVAALAHRYQTTGRTGRLACKPFGRTGFYEHYCIPQGDEDDGAEERESVESEGVKGYVEGLHSPWGMIWQVATQTGWTLKYILWKVNYPSMIMMSADAGRYVNGERNKKVTIKSEEELYAALSKKLKT